jgi:ABC-type amino acid transport substrate-binding protein
MNRLVFLIACLACAAPARAETIRVLALESDFFFYQKNGKPAGIEYDILEYFAKSRNAELEVIWVDSFASVLEGIQKRQGDVAAGTITITPERMLRMSFSAPYFPVQLTLVEKMNAKTASLVDLKGTRVGAFTKTTAEDALLAVPGIQIVNEGTLGEMMEAVVKGELRAVVADSSAVIPALADFPSLKVGLTLGEEQSFGFALPKGSPLREPLSRLVLKLKESGIYYRLVTAHMGERASDIVRAAKAQ